MNQRDETARAEAQINAQVPEAERGRAIEALHRAIDAERGLEYGMRVRFDRIVKAVIENFAPRPAPVEVVDTDDTDGAVHPLLAEAEREIRSRPMPAIRPMKKDGSMMTPAEWQAAALDGVRTLLDHTAPAPAAKPAWEAPEEPLGLDAKISRARGLKALVTDTPTQMHPVRKAEAADYMLSRHAEPWTATDETEWIERELQPELRGAEKISAEALRAKAPPGMFRSLTVPEFQVKISRHRKKLGIN